MYGERMKQLVDMGKLAPNRKVKKSSEAFICGKAISTFGGELLFACSLKG